MTELTNQNSKQIHATAASFWLVEKVARFSPAIERSKVKPKQMQITFDCSVDPLYSFL